MYPHFRSMAVIAYILQSLPSLFSGGFLGGLLCFAFGCIFTIVTTVLGIVSLLCGSRVIGPSSSACTLAGLPAFTCTPHAKFQEVAMRWAEEAAL